MLKQFKKMKTTIFACGMLGLLFFQGTTANAQVALPQNNFGIANMLDGAPKELGAVLFQTIQSYDNDGIILPDGSNLGIEVSSLLSMTQFAWNTNKTFLGGHIGFTVLQPIVKLYSNVLSVNPSTRGDLIVGPSLQWMDKRLLGKPFFHRFEVDAILPTGAYSTDYVVNPSANLYMTSIHHAFTWFFTEKFAVSMKNHVNFSTKEIELGNTPGSYFNNNYSLEYGISKKLRVMTCGYMVGQMTDDLNADGEKLVDDSEQTFAYGLGFSWGVPGGLIEFKTMWETGSENRGEGNRTTLRLLMPLWKNKPIQ